MTIASGAHPYLIFGDADQVMPWTHGSLYSLQLRSSFIRITQRGMQYSNSKSLLDLASTQWHSARCEPTLDGLCDMMSHAGSMIWFPDTAVALPDDFSRLPDNAYMQRFPNGSACTSMHTGRAVSMADERYEVSLCDLLDSNLDVIMQDNTISWRQDTTAVWIYVVISVFCIYLISCISENIVCSIHNTAHHEFRRQRYTVYASLCLIAYVLFIDNGQRFLVTTEDKALMWHLCVYVAAQAIAQAWEVTHELHGTRISLFTASISLLTLRIHYSFDNPYTLILCIIFGVRSMFKFIACHTLHTSAPELLLQLLDMFTFCSLLDNGLMSNSIDHFSGVATQLTVVVVCFLMAVQIFVYKNAGTV
jgi:hypothetical protein